MTEDKLKKPERKYLCRRENCEKKYFTPLEKHNFAAPDDYVIGVCKEDNCRIFFNDICRFL